MPGTSFSGPLLSVLISEPLLGEYYQNKPRSPKRATFQNTLDRVLSIWPQVYYLEVLIEAKTVITVIGKHFLEVSLFFKSS